MGSTYRVPSMSLHVKICRDGSETWSVHGPSPGLVNHFPSLSASLACAREKCSAAPTTIELFVEGLYVVIHQEQGWPRQILSPKTDTSDLSCPPDSAASARLNPARATTLTQNIWRLGDILGRLQHAFSRAGSRLLGFVVGGGPSELRRWTRSGAEL